MTQNNIATSESGAVFSDDNLHRYALWRVWDKTKPKCMFIGLNPSTADAYIDDPTVRRCIGFSKAWGYGGLIMANLFAYRATKPKDMKRYPSPIGELNDEYLKRLATESGLVLAAWGNDGGFMNRDKQVLRMLNNIHYLKLNKGGSPAHPLYLPSNLKPKLLHDGKR